MLKITTLAAGLALAGLASPAMADGRIDNRQDRQQTRIINGVKSGELTGRETARLVRQQAQIRQFERQSRRDGPGLTPRERVRIENKQDRASRNIARARNNPRSR